MPDGDYAAYIEEEAGVKVPEGNFVLTDGTVLGRHKGITHYTVGQRKGLGLALGYPAFVLEIRPETNEVVIGTKRRIHDYTTSSQKSEFYGSGRFNRAFTCIYQNTL